MATIAQSIRLEPELLDFFDQLALATGRPRNQLFVEALKRYAAIEGWQIQQVRATLARMDEGTLTSIPGEQVVADLLARGRLTQAALDEARAGLGVPRPSDW